MNCKDEASRSFFSRFFRNFVEAFNPMGSDPGTIFLRDLIHTSPVELSGLLQTRTHRPILFDLRNRHELECFPFTICDALQVGDLDWGALLDSVPSENVVILFGTDNQSVAHLKIFSIPEGCEVWMLRGGLQEWYETGLPLNALHDQQAYSKKEVR